MIYSPSQAKVYLECPIKRQLSQEGWNSRIVGIRDWIAWVGQGVHAGLAACQGGREPHPDIVSIGQDEFVKYYDHAIKSGRIIPNTFYVSEAKAHIERCLEYAMKNDLLPTGFEVERVEQSLGDYNCILDVVGKKNGKPTFIDWKVKNKCKPDYIDQELERYRYDWKEARHYPWALSEVTGQRVEDYSVVMFILQPFKVVQRTYEVNWKMVERWALGCMGPKLTGELDGLWDTMTYEEPWQSNMCHPAMGFPCEYLDACWTYDLDREKMKHGGLIQVERLKPQTLATSQETEQGGA
jgi:hypothetical protein